MDTEQVREYTLYEPVLHLKSFQELTTQELTTDELYELLRVRSEVFVVEQDCVYQDLDGDDQKSIHLWLTLANKIVALARVCPAGTHMPEISIGRVITTERGKGYGKQIMLYAIDTAIKYFHATRIDIEAQEYAKGFYEGVGFRQSSESFMLDGIPHIRMTWTETSKKTILFLHGFYASGQCVPAMALREAFEGKANVLTPDLPLHPNDAIRLIRDICDKEKPDVLVGNSCGSFYAQMISQTVGIPALLGNPYFKMSDFLRERIGTHKYKSPRADGKQDFTIDEQLISEFEAMEAHQFDCCNLYNKERVWGLFGEEDTLAHFEPLFLKHYQNSYHFPGGHTPTA